MNADELVSAWALNKYRKDYRTYYAALEHFYDHHHLFNCETVTATPVSCGWECSCYSEYTRYDSFRTSFTISCACDVSIVFDVDTYNVWDLPEILMELEEYESTQECPYWEDE